jgi:predicted Zn-dependent peptidase
MIQFLNLAGQKLKNMIIKKTLENGLRVILAPLEKTQSFSVFIFVKVGSKYETKSKRGISHFLEHMCFKGTERRPDPLSISKELDRVGGVFNAFTSKDYTGYFVKVEKNYMPLALDVVSDIFLNSLFKEEEIEKEKTVILEEIKMIKDNPTLYIDVLFEKLLYGDQPAGWSIAGEEETVKNIKRKDILNWVNNFYLAPNTVLSIAGNFKVNEVLSKIKNYFLKLRPGKSPQKKKVIEKQKTPKKLIFQKDTEQAHIALGVRGFNLFHPLRYPFLVLATLLGGNMSSRLFQRLREKEGLAYYVHTDIETNPDTGYLCTFTGVDRSKIRDAVKIILEEYKNVTKEISEKEIELAKNYLKGRLMLSLEETNSLASFYGIQELLEKKILTPQQKIKEIDKVKKEDIQKASQMIFKPQKLNLALISPLKPKNLKLTL